MNRFSLVVLLMILAPLSVDADVIILKSGRRVEVDMAWQEGDQVKGTLSGVNLTYPKGEVERIERSTAEDLAAGNAGFKFSVWNSGMNLSDAQSIAKNNNINLKRIESTTATTAPDDSATGRHRTAGIIYRYDEKILDKSAGVELVFTPASATLYLLSIRWTNLSDSVRSEFLNKVVASLIDRYGKPVKKNTTLFYTTFIWDINKSSTVETRTHKKNIEIKFIDSAIEQLAEKESGTIK
ncbi:MAG: hypothetical protein PVI06_01260 [Desulfobacterales bacterium]